MKVIGTVATAGATTSKWIAVLVKTNYFAWFSDEFFFSLNGFKVVGGERPIACSITKDSLEIIIWVSLG